MLDLTSSQVSKKVDIYFREVLCACTDTTVNRSPKFPVVYSSSGSSTPDGTHLNTIAVKSSTYDIAVGDTIRIFF